MYYPELKIHIKTLAAEARFIRTEERKQKGSYLWLKDRDQHDQSNNPSGEQVWSWCTHRDLHLHRTVKVRHEARAAQLAYAFLRGRPLRLVEGDIRERPKWSRVRSLVLKYHPRGGTDREAVVILDELKQWIVDAGTHEFMQPAYSIKNWLA